MAAECTVPELGESIESATVVEVFVKVGDVIRLEQAVLSLETDKAEFEMPSNVEGTVTELLVSAGDEVKVGQAVLRVDAGRADASKNESSAKAEKERAEEVAEDRPSASPVTPHEVPSSPTRAPATSATPKPRHTTAPNADVLIADTGPSRPIATPENEAAAAASSGVAAAPSVRRLARELGIDVTRVRGSGPGGRVSAEDVTAHVRATHQRAAMPGASDTAAGSSDFTRWGDVEVEPMSKVRAKTAERMTLAWNSIPHVTHHDKADVTELDRLRRQYAKRVESAGGKLTMTAVLLKVLGSALRKFPNFNASVDMNEGAIVYKKYVHVGVAVDTERGLLVPVVRDVDTKNIVEIARALREMSDKARGRNIKPEELQGASFTITNLGGIGGTAFSPLINPPEVAVLGVASARLEPVFVDDAFEPRLLLPLSVSYDHRVIDGADAARFLRWVCEALAEPFVMDLEGR